jgi:hypothetical protein
MYKIKILSQLCSFGISLDISEARSCARNFVLETNLLSTKFAMMRYLNYDEKEKVSKNLTQNN